MNAVPSQSILIIDDDSFSRAFAVAVLEDAGYQTRQADTGVKGIVAAIQSKPDLILLDYAMPASSGIKVMEGLTTIHELSSTPVIVLSAWQSDGVRKKVEHLGALWLDKPVSGAVLVAAIKRRLAH